MIKLKKLPLLLAGLTASVVLAAGVSYVESGDVTQPADHTVKMVAKKEPKVTSKKSISGLLTPVNASMIKMNAPGLSSDAVDTAIKAYNWSVTHGYVDNPNVLTIVDFTKPSYEKRLWVIDLRTSQVLLNAYTTQGKNSGVTMATVFSNKPNSDQSSLGVYKTLKSYQGKHGKSLRLAGLEKGINDNAKKRAIVIHPAWYATPQFIKEHHRAGRSWGCFAIDPKISSQIVDLTKGGSIVFAYAMQEQYDTNFSGV